MALASWEGVDLSALCPAGPWIHECLHTHVRVWSLIHKCLHTGTLSRLIRRLPLAVPESVHLGFVVVVPCWPLDVLVNLKVEISVDFSRNAFGQLTKTLYDCLIVCIGAH